MTQALKYGWADITKSEQLANGDVMVEGIVASTSLDLDGQRMNAAFLAKALPKWYEWANIREQHGPVAAGVGTEMTDQGKGTWAIKALIVDPVAKAKVLAKVYKGFSVGIKDALVRKSVLAPKGEIMDGNIVEISLTDRPSNSDSKLSICKSAGGSMLPIDSEGHIIMETWLTPELHKAASATAADVLAGDFEGDSADELDAIGSLVDLMIAEGMTVKSALVDGTAGDVDISQLQSAYEALSFFADAHQADADLMDLDKSAGTGGTIDIAKIVEAEVTKAVGAQAALIEGLRSELAEVKSRAVQAGPRVFKMPVAQVAKSAASETVSRLLQQATVPSMDPALAALTRQVAEEEGALT